MTAELPLRLPKEGEEGTRFIDWLDQQVASSRPRRERLAAFIQAYDNLRDEVQDRELREPTLEEYAAEWNVAVSSAYRIQDEFREALGIDNPGDLCDLLWGGMPKWTGKGPISMPKWLLAVEIVPV